MSFISAALSKFISETNRKSQLGGPTPAIVPPSTTHVQNITWAQKVAEQNKEVRDDMLYRDSRAAVPATRQALHVQLDRYERAGDEKMAQTTRIVLEENERIGTETKEQFLQTLGKGAERS